MNEAPAATSVFSTKMQMTENHIFVVKKDQLKNSAKVFVYDRNSKSASVVEIKFTSDVAPVLSDLLVDKDQLVAKLSPRNPQEAVQYFSLGRLDSMVVKPSLSNLPEQLKVSRVIEPIQGNHFGGYTGGSTFSSDAQYALSYDGFSFYVTDLKIGKIVHKISAPDSIFTNGIHAIPTSPFAKADQKFFITTRAGKSYILDISTGKFSDVSREYTFRQPLAWYEGTIFRFEKSYYTSLDSQIWTLPNGSSDQPKAIYYKRTPLTHHLIESPNGDYIVLDDGNAVIKIDLKAGNSRTILEHTGQISGLVISHDSNFIASSSWDDRRVKIVNAQDHTTISTILENQAPTALAFNPTNSKQLAIATLQGLKIADVMTGKSISLSLPKTYNSRHSDIYSLVHKIKYSPDGKYLFVATDNGTIFEIQL